MTRELAFAFLFLSLIFKTIALSKVSSKTATLEEKKANYKKFNLPSYIFLLIGVALLIYLKYLG